MTTPNGIRILFNRAKTEDEREKAIMMIQESVRKICAEHDIYQPELNITSQDHLP
jgi:hypothetical protein